MKVWKVILATLVIFLTGAMTGGLITRSYIDPSPRLITQVDSPPMWRLQHVEFLRRIAKQLNLSPEQQTRIEKIMRDSHERTKPTWDQISPKLREELREVRQQIQAELDSEQQKKFESLLKTRSYKFNEPPLERPAKRRPPISTNQDSGRGKP